MSKEFYRRKKLNSNNETQPKGKDPFNFVMNANGVLLKRGMPETSFNSKEVMQIKNDLKAVDVSLFGPGGASREFNRVGVSATIYESLASESVLQMIQKVMNENLPSARRVAFLLGGLILHQDWSVRRDSAKLMADIVGLGNAKSYDAIAVATFNHLVNVGEPKVSGNFREDAKTISDSIAEDNIQKLQTRDLGLSQAVRVQKFFRKQRGIDATTPDIKEPLKELNGFPTVGAEFHLRPENVDNDFWERAAIWNMSQFQFGSPIQMTRKDQGVVEVRMNPSVAPVTIANYNLLTLLLPEVRNAYFTTTLNQDGKKFSIMNSNDAEVMGRLNSLGLLAFASFYENSPKHGKAEISFGESYMGQTYQIVNGRKKFDGSWGYGSRSYGQIGIYTGFGGTFPFFAHTLSLALKEPDLLDPKWFKEEIKTPNDALNFPAKKRVEIFNRFHESALSDPRLKRAHAAGEQIIDALSY